MSDSICDNVCGDGVCTGTGTCEESCRRRSFPVRGAAVVAVVAKFCGGLACDISAAIRLCRQCFFMRAAKR